MKTPIRLECEFVKSFPEKLRERTLYVSIEYATVSHKCCCGCGNEVVTPLSPTDWKLTYDGVSVSLFPSIGNWSFPCQSHYWIESNTVKWAGQLSRAQIEAGRAHDRQLKQRQYGSGQETPRTKNPAGPDERKGDKPPKHLWARLSKLWSR